VVEGTAVELFEVLEQQLVDRPPVGGDVTAEAVRRGWVRPFADGQYLYGAAWTGLLRRLQTMLLDRAGRLSFSEYLFPRLIPADAVDDFRLSQFRPDMLWRLDDAARVLDPVQCLSFYHGFRGSRFGLPALPVKIVETMGGWTWRRERREDLDGVFRTVEFSRVEHVWLGTPEQVRETRGQVLDSVVRFVGDLGLSVRTVAGEGCMPIEAIRSRMRDAESVEDVPVIDIEVQVRDPGPPGSPQFDEISGCTVEGDHHLDSFGIAREDGGPLWSGCCGVGLNRLVVGFLYQHGFDEGAWPI
jgi:seryl-tRNA synthetase